MSIEEQIVELLKKNKKKISVAESCTGGMISSRIVNVAGCSDVYEQGFVTYANYAKVRYLGVKEETIVAHGVVSKEVVEEMAYGCAVNSNAQVSVVTSGIAGPGGGTPSKPVGLVWMAVYVDGDVYSRSFVFDGNREQVRTAATNKALEFVKEMIE